MNGMVDLGGIVRDAMDKVECSLSGRVLYGRWFFGGCSGDGGLFEGALF